ncbi:MAG: transcriptional regulator MraZ [Actinomycetales bacterium]|nr:division/cell wall cluster transcriptional repressor MraZ [Aeromicrobium sp. Leaf245]KQP26470.1 division/cell wall cluster transcriptional repressor MraZ [Aeromicrobium sp. Leaf272]KQP76210.1 division/cell wall cluster transcriptional repressor MraZ [Aeromicrobium sp. Leaf289]KQP85314.1 division/cell wall cluster transcriptional repressor MraZ [Aeromicrobium sp. Leaf291]RYY50626.1 MAG: transcriptional regulator MraZ [Actinomycetales bacterium]
MDANNFFGTYTPRLDDKSRLFLPAKFRPRLEGGIVLTRGQENCIYGWTTDSFSAFTDRIRETPFTNREARNFVRMLYSGASSEVPDKQGRISIPPVLRSWAGLERDVAVVGAMDRLEIWDARRWDEYSSSQEEQFSDMSDEVMPGIF